VKRRAGKQPAKRPQCFHELKEVYTAADRISRSYPYAYVLKPHEQIEMIADIIRRTVRFRCRKEPRRKMR